MSSGFWCNLLKKSLNLQKISEFFYILGLIHEIKNLIVLDSFKNLSVSIVIYYVRNKKFLKYSTSFCFCSSERFLLHLFFFFFYSKILIFFWGLFLPFLFSSSERFWYLSCASFWSLNNIYLSFLHIEKKYIKNKF